MNWQASLDVIDSIDLNNIHGDILHKILVELYLVFEYTKNYSRCESLLRYFEETYVDEFIIDKTNHLLQYKRIGKTVIASFDTSRKPLENEIIICYGDYPHIAENLPHCNPMRRHLKYFWELSHDIVEYDPLWDPVDAIYIINIDERIDRYIETLRELRRMKAPFDRIHRFSAIKDESTNNSYLNGTIGCAKSHLGVVDNSLKRGYHQILILEDDFCFIDGLDQHRKNLEAFFKRKYDYHVCLLAASKYYRSSHYDDLLNQSHQECTTCAGYLLSEEGQLRVQSVWEKALAKLIKTRNTNNACDRSWACLQQEGKFFMFRQKMGFQRPTYSSITGKTEFYMD